MAETETQAGGSVRLDEVLSLAELRRRFAWGEDMVRRARQEGLRLISFGRSKYALGADVLDFFRRLAEKPGGNGNGE